MTEWDRVGILAAITRAGDGSVTRGPGLLGAVGWELCRSNPMIGQLLATETS